MQLRSLLELLDPISPRIAQVGAGVLILLVAAMTAGVAGAWQTAVAGVRSRRDIVLIGAACPGAACIAASLALSISASLDPARALLEITIIAGGAGAGAWLLPTVALMLTRLRGGRCGQTSAEYLGALVLVAVIIAALVTGAPLVGNRTSGLIDAIADGKETSAQRTNPTTGANPSALGSDPTPGTDTFALGAPSTTTHANPTDDSDDDSLTSEEEENLGTSPNTADSDGDGVSDGDEFTVGTDPLQGVTPLNSENVSRPWERLGITEDEWRALEDTILDEVNPGAVEGFLLGNAASALQLDENGELVIIPPGAIYTYRDGKLVISEIQEAGMGGVVKGAAKLLGAGGKSTSAALRSALDKLPANVRSRLAGVGVTPASSAPRMAPGSLTYHFNKHGSKFGYETPAQYLRGASSLVGRKGVRTFTRKNGDRLYYDVARNEFAVMRPDGVLRTYYRPDTGLAYWKAQVGKG